MKDLRESVSQYIKLKYFANVPSNTRESQCRTVIEVGDGEEIDDMSNDSLTRSVQNAAIAKSLHECQQPRKREEIHTESR